MPSSHRPLRIVAVSGGLQRPSRATLLAEHLLGVPAGDNVIRLLPPLVTTAEEAREGLARVEAAAASLTAKQAKIA